MNVESGTVCPTGVPDRLINILSHDYQLSCIKNIFYLYEHTMYSVIVLVILIIFVQLLII